MFRGRNPVIDSPSARILALTALSIAAATALWVTNRARERNEIIAEHLRAEQVLATTGAGAIGAILDGFVSDLDRLSRVASVRYLEDPERLERTLSSFFDRTPVPVLAVLRVDSAGRILFAYPENALATEVLESLGASEYLYRAGRSGVSLLEGPVAGPGQGGLLALSDVVQPDDSPTLGALVALFPASFLARPIYAPGGLPGRGVRIQDGRGRILWEAPLSEHPSFKLVAPVPSSTNPALSVHFSSTMEAALAPVARTLKVQLALLLVLNSLIGTFGFFLARELGLRRTLEQGREHRRQLEERLQQSAKLESIGTLAGGIAHDFNNILTAIQGSAQLLQDQLAPDGATQEDLSAIIGACDHAADLTRQLLAFARRQTLHARPVRPNEVVTRMEPILRRLLPEDVLLTVDLRSADRWIVIDPVQLEQVILNLSTNARDAMPQGGHLRISTEDVLASGPDGQSAPGAHLRLTIRDSGDGIPAAAVPHIFEPFFTTKSLGRGTGLGLATVYGIVEQSGGRIRVETAPGEGTSFILQFPATDSRPVADGANGDGPAAEYDRDISGTVLLVDDDDGVRRITQRSLSRAGYQVLTARTAEEALQVSADPGLTIDLLLTDVVMPGMNGAELADRVTAARPSVSVLFISGYNDADVESRGVRRGRSSFLAKPFTLDDLSRAVGAALSKGNGTSARD